MKPAWHGKKRHRKRDDEPETTDYTYGFKIHNVSRQGELAHEIRKLEDHINILKRTVLKNDGRFKEYGSSRDTAGGGPIVMGEPKVAGDTGPRGPVGPRGATGPTGPTGPSGLDGNADFMLLEAVQTGTTNHSITQMDYKISGSIDMLASHQVKRGVGGGFYSVGLLFKPGMYEVTLTFRRTNSSNADLFYGFDIGGDYGIRSGSNSDPGATADWGTNSYNTTTTTRTFVVPNSRMFYILDRSTNTYYNDLVYTPQIMFKRIGHVETTGTASTLQDHVGHANTDTKTIAGGIYWIANHVYPPSGYHPSDHPSQGGSNEFAAIELAEETSQTVFGWIHRVKRFI